jgi:hypothetical protein
LLLSKLNTPVCFFGLGLKDPVLTDTPFLDVEDVSGDDFSDSKRDNGDLVCKLVLICDFYLKAEKVSVFAPFDDVSDREESALRRKCHFFGNKLLEDLCFKFLTEGPWLVRIQQFFEPRAALSGRHGLV